MLLQMDWAILFVLCLLKVRFTIPKQQQMFYRKLTYPAVIFSVIKSMVLKKQNLHYRVKYTIPPRENNTEPWYCDYWLYKERHPAECIFNKIKAFAELLLVMISLIHRFLLSYTLLPFGFCPNNTTLLGFQIRSIIRGDLKCFNSRYKPDNFRKNCELRIILQ